MAEINDINDPVGELNRSLDFRYGGNLANMGDHPQQLTAVLQSTLELNQLLELFGQEINRSVPHDGLFFRNREQHYAIELGTYAHHCCSYQLYLREERLGELLFYRKTRFSDSEIEQVEKMVATLIYPLRNALLYKKAVDDANTDPVTGINNRAALDSSLSQEINLAKRYHTPLSIIMLDIDKFKQINDTYGHITGDAVLKTIAQCMSDSIRGSDMIYRYGGEEFVILLRNTAVRGAHLLAQRIRQKIETLKIYHDNHEIQVTISAGIASLQGRDSEEVFLKHCDDALYQAKERGRNTVVVANI